MDEAASDEDEQLLRAPASDSCLHHVDRTQLAQALAPVRASTRPALWTLMERRIKAREYTDLQVRIGDELIRCHLMPLQCFSEYFEREVRPGQAVVELPEAEIHPDAFRTVYEWILDPERRLEWQHFVPVLAAAEFLQVPALVERCWLHLDNPRVVENVAFYVFTQALRFAHGAELQTMMLRRICRYFLALASTPEFCELSLTDLAVLLSSNIIAVFDETDVLYAACQWLLYDWPDRHELIEDVMSLVRFRNIRASDLARLCIFHECGELQPILRHPATKQQVDEALAFICARPSSSIFSRSGGEGAAGPKRCLSERVRLVPDTAETLAYVATDASYDAFKEFLALLQRDATLWRTFRVSEASAGPLDDMFGCVDGK